MKHIKKGYICADNSSEDSNRVHTLRSLHITVHFDTLPSEEMRLHWYPSDLYSSIKIKSSRRKKYSCPQSVLGIFNNIGFGSARSYKVLGVWGIGWFFRRCPVSSITAVHNHFSNLDYVRNVAQNDTHDIHPFYSKYWYRTLRCMNLYLQQHYL